jgi:hypothetical protein
VRVRVEVGLMLVDFFPSYRLIAPVITAFAFEDKTAAWQLRRAPNDAQEHGPPWTLALALPACAPRWPLIWILKRPGIYVHASVQGNY